jgi:hypothetical protein
MHSPIEYDLTTRSLGQSSDMTESMDELESAWMRRPYPTSYADGISTRAVLGSLLVLGAIGTGAFLLVHSLVLGDPSHIRAPAIVQAPAPAASSATLIPLSPVTTVAEPPAIPGFGLSQAATPPVASTTPSPAASHSTMPIAATMSKQAASTFGRIPPPPMVTPRVHVYPVPVFAPETSGPDHAGRGAQVDTSETNPYDEDTATSNQ